MNSIDMILFCPSCGFQHIDRPEPAAPIEDRDPAFEVAVTSVWHNPPHRSHLCAQCGFIWRPADVPTNGVAEITTHGENDHTAIRGLARSVRTKYDGAIK